MSGPPPRAADASAGAMPADPDAGAEVLLQVDSVVKYFPIKSGGMMSRHIGDVKAVDGVSLTLRQGQTLGVVGETGCGKSVTASAIIRLLPRNAAIAGGSPFAAST